MSNGIVESSAQGKAVQDGAQGASAPGATFERVRDSVKKAGMLPLLIAGAFGIALVAALFLWASGPEYRVLFNNLSEADGGRIIAELDSRGVSYEFSPGGQAILVPADQVHSLRLQLAEQGLPAAGNVGFELMDEQPFGISQFAEQVNYQRGLEGELARSIQSMNPVAEARVHLSMAKPSVFVRESQPAKASVVLRLQPGRSLAENQISAIRHLVASSVPDLAVEGVTVVDHEGKLLSKNDSGYLDGEQLDYVQEIERRFQGRIENILSPLFGRDNIRVQVAAEVDFSVREETLERYGPNQGQALPAAVRSAQLSGALNGDEALARGIPGALSNTPPGWAPSPVEQAAEADGDAAVADAQGNLRYDNVVNYEVDRSITHIQHNSGSLQRLSVAAVVNHRQGLDAEGNAVELPLSEDELAQVTRLVQQAMGFSAARGDELEVVNTRFAALPVDVSTVPEWWQQPGMPDLILTLVRWILVALAVLALYFTILRPLLRQHLVPPATAGVPAVAGGVSAAALEEALQAELEDRAASSGLDGELLRAEHRRKRQQKSSSYDEDLLEARRLAMEDPRLVAMVVRSWMAKND